VGVKKYIGGGNALEKSIKGTDFDNLDLLPAAFSLRRLDIAINDMKRAQQRLRKMLSPLQKTYDLIVLDSPPTINLVAENIFVAADTILVPIIPTTLSMRAFEQLRGFFKKEAYPQKKLFAFFSMVDRRKNMHRETEQTMRKTYRRMLETPIPYLSLVERMGDERQPIPAFAPRSTAAQAYVNLWNELTARTTLSRKT